MRRSAFILVCVLAVPLCAQETQSDPIPVEPQTTAKVKPQQPSTPQQQQSAAPIVRRASKPTASTGPVDGPMGSAGAAQPVSSAQAPVARDGGTLRVETRLVNVGVTVLDEHGSPIGGFERGDFQLFEDGKPQPTAVFEREAGSPLSIVLAVDSSETVMTSERLEREAAKHFIEATVRQQDELDLMDFSDTVREIVPFTNQVKRIEAALGDIKQGDQTALYDAIYLASQRLAETHNEVGRRRVLVLISDGGDSAKSMRYEQAMEQAQRAGVMIYSIIIVPVAADAGRNTGGEHALIQMSNDTGGRYYYVEDPKQLEPTFRQLSEDLRTQYLLGYYAPEQGTAGFRRIKVTLTGEAAERKLNLRYRTGYYANGH